MCGICGVIGEPVSRDLLQRMCEAMAHRGPDDEGIYLQGKAGLGIRRLAIIDLIRGHQPISNEENFLWIVLNGEIYNYRELRKDLIEKGHKFKTNSDTEVILHSYEEFGQDSLTYLNGMFAFAIWNERKRELFIARDRLGIKPLFYWHRNGRFVFASEIKSILQDEEFEREIDYISLGNYLARRYVPGDSTIFSGIKSLDPGHWLKLQDGKIKIRKYWDIDFSEKLKLDKSEYCEAIIELLEKSIGRRLIADVPVGILLSGGIDSSLVLALATKQSNDGIKTFTLGFEGSRESTYALNELDYARETSQFYNSNHFEKLLTPNELINKLPVICWHFDQPYAGALPQFALSQFVHEHIKVTLAGLGGDELFGNYRRPFLLEEMIGPLFMKLQKFPEIIRTRLLGPCLGVLPNWGRFGVYRKKSLLITGPDQGEANLYRQMLDNFTFVQMNQLCLPETLSKMKNNEGLSDRIRKLYMENSTAERGDKIFYVDMKTQLVDEYFFYTDILSMAHSLEVRVPFLDHELLEFVAKIPFSVRSNNDDDKYLLKKAAARVLPNQVLQRKKMGFSLPMDTWIRKDLKPVIRFFLSPDRIKKQGLFNWGYVQQLLGHHFLNIDTYNTHPIWTLFMFQLWHWIYLENNCSSLSEVTDLSSSLSNQVFSPK